MSNRCRLLVLRWSLVAIVVGLASYAAFAAAPATAGELDKLNTSLKLVPDNAAFYSSMLRNREQFEAIAKSRAWAKLQGMPIVQMGWALYGMTAANPESVPGKIQAALQNPDVRKLIDLAADMTAQDVFLYGDATCGDFIELAQQMAGAMRYGPAILQISGKARGIDPNKVQGMVLLAALSEHIDLIKAPDMVIGFKLGNTAAAKEQLAKLEGLATAVFQSDPRLEGRFKRTKVGDNEYLVLSLDGQLVPWSELPLDQFKDIEANKGDIDKIVEKLKKTTLVIALGLRDDYLLMSIGASTDVLTHLGGSSRLIDRAEFKPLEKHADKRLVSVGYLSKAMASRLTNNKKDIDDLLSAVNELLPLAELKDEQKDRIRKDAAALGEDIKRFVPENGAMMAFSFLTEQGVEGYQYTWGDHNQFDASKPLGLLEHVGGNPLMAFVGRGKSSPEGYDLLVKWLKVGYGYVEEFALPKMPPVEREQFQKVAGLALPLVQRLDKANREMLIPALADGQVGLVLDRKLESKRFLDALPATEKALPMIEPAIVMGVSDAALLKKGCEEYHAVANALIDVLRQIDGVDLPPDFKLPEAKVTKAAGGEIFGYTLPKDWGLDKKIVPNFGISDHVAVMSISRKHTQRLLTATPLSVGGALIKTDRPLAAAVVFDWAGLLDVVTPWIDLGIEQATKQGGKEQAPMIAAQVHTVLDVLKVLKTISGETYVEDGVMVTHSLVEIQDLPQ